MDTVLFDKEDLREEMERAARSLAEHIARRNPDLVLNTPEPDLVEELVIAASIACPELLVEDAWMLPVTEFTQRLGLYGDGHPITRQIPRMVLVVPFTGDRRVFLARASRRSLNPPRILDLREDALELFVDGPFAKNTSLRANFDAQIETIRQHLDWARADIGPYNARLRAEVPDMVRRRREELLTARNTQAQIGFPILRRAEAQTYPVPLVKRPFRPARPTPKAGAPFKPEPALEQADYEAALGVLRYWRDSLERSPSIVDGRGEEEIRDLLLGALNLVFEGAAAGEVFNGDGKTDILIRVDNAHIFIGECKIWTGVDSMDEALAQIFKYLVWRDTKAAILLFIRNKDATTVIEKAMKQIKDHPNFKRTESPLAASEYNFVMHATGDPLREIRLALVPFALRAKSIRLGRS